MASLPANSLEPLRAPPALIFMVFAQLYNSFVG